MGDGNTQPAPQAGDDHTGGKGHHGPLAGVSPKQWWQWVLVYPALGISLLTAAPKWVDQALAAVHNVENRSYAEAKLQSDRWARNLPCTAFPLNYASTESNVQLDATICNSGDIFVRASTPDKKSHFYWVPIERIVGQDVKEPSVLSGAQAAEAPLGGAHVTGAVLREIDRADLLKRIQNVMCQRILDPRHVIQRIFTPQGCFDRVIDTYTGQVVSMTPAPCSC